MLELQFFYTRYKLAYVLFKLLHYLGWFWLNIIAVPAIAVALATTLWYAATVRRARARPA